MVKAEIAYCWLRKLEEVLLLGVFFSIPILLGYHFWPSFSFVSGIRLDYISPTLYFSDIIIVLFIFTSGAHTLLQRSALSSRILIICTLLLYFVLQSFSAFSQQLHYYGVIKFFEFLILGYLVSRNLRSRHLRRISFVLLFWVIIEVFISLYHIVHGSSINGVFYYLGERFLIPSQPGVSSVLLFDNTYLRGYGTFPHPNVLAFFFGFSLLVFFFHSFIASFFRKFAISMCVLGILITFSKTVIIFFLLFFFIYSFTVACKKVCYSILFFVVAVFLLFVFLFSPYSLFSRVDLLHTASDIFVQHPIIGGGFFQFFYLQGLFQSSLSPHFLQPVHSIYFLILIQFGIIGFLCVLYFIFLSFRVISLVSVERARLFKASLLLYILFVGFFDHYLLTLQQGSLMLSLILGIIWSKRI